MYQGMVLAVHPDRDQVCMVSRQLHIEC